MGRKRGHNEGTIFKTEYDTWRVMVRLDGKRLSKTFPTRRDAADWLRSTLNAVDAGLTYTSSRTTVAEFLQGWLTSIRPTLRQSTWDQHSLYVQDYINPKIGRVKLKELRPTHIQRMYDQWGEEKSAWTVIKIHSTLYNALGYAQQTGVLTVNPASSVLVPKEPEREIQIWDESEISQFLISVRGDKLEALYHLAITTGMRQMELLGLKWEDLDWVKQTIDVRRQLLRKPIDGERFGPLKTKFGRRIVALGDQTIEILREHEKRQHEERMFNQHKWQEMGMMFTSSIGTPYSYRNLLRRFKKLTAEAGLPEIRFHDLRHTAASLMLNHGIPLIVVSRRLGHARASITLDIYGHLIPGKQQEAAELMDSLVTPIEVEID